MTHAEAELLWAALIAAYPYPTPPEATRLLYVRRLERLDDAAVAHAAVDGLIDTASRMPPIADLLRDYEAIARRRRDEQARRQRALPEPVPDQAENLRRIQELMQRLTDGMAA